jgi:hypothetical protein
MERRHPQRWSKLRTLALLLTVVPQHSLCPQPDLKAPMRSSLLDFRECSIANSQTVRNHCFRLVQYGRLPRMWTALKRRDGIVSVGLATLDAPAGPSSQSLGFSVFPTSARLLNLAHSLTTVAQRPNIVIERATSSYSFRSSELSQPI